MPIQATDEAAHPRDYRSVVLIAFLVAVAINGAVIGWAFWYSAQLPEVKLSKPQVEGVTELCPGDTLNYQFVLSVTKKASVDLYTSVDHESPTDKVSYTRLQQFRFDKQSDLELIRHWILPPTYLDPVSGTQVAWMPGLYVQRTSASIVGGRNGPAEIEVPFAVKVSCEIR